MGPNIHLELRVESTVESLKEHKYQNMAATNEQNWEVSIQLYGKKVSLKPERSSWS